MLLVVLFVTAIVCQSDTEWQQYKEKYGKVYATAEEEQLRRNCWAQAQRTVKENNQVKQYLSETNEWSDRTEEEWKGMPFCYFSDEDS